MRERLRPAPEPPLKIRPSSWYQFRIESIESSTARMKQALTCCGDAGADVEPDRRVEAEDLVQQHPGQLVLEDLGVALGGEVAVLLAGRAVGAHDPVDELAQAPLALRRADRAAEVLGGDDVGRVDGPEVGELDAALLEVDRAVAPVGHDDVAALPGHLVVGVHAGGGVDALDLAGPCPARRLAAAAGAAAGQAVVGLGHGVELSLVVMLRSCVAGGVGARCVPRSVARACRRTSRDRGSGCCLAGGAGRSRCRDGAGGGSAAPRCRACSSAISFSKSSSELKDR